MALYTHNNLVNLFKSIVEAHLQMGTSQHFGYGTLAEMNGLSEKAFPFLRVTPLSAQPVKNDSGEYATIQHHFEVEVTDLVQKDLSNLQEVSSDTLQILTDIVKVLHEQVDDIDTVDDPQCNWNTEKGNDNVTGWWAELVIEIPFDSSFCDLPIEDFGISGIGDAGGITSRFLTCESLSTCSTFSDLADHVTTIEDTYVPESRTLTINGQTYDLSANRSWTISSSSLPSQTGHAGEFLTTDGNTASWAPIDLSAYATIASLATVAFSGDYNDLINTPSIPTNYWTLVGNDLFLSDAYDQVSPDATNTTDLGSSSLYWKDVYVKGKILQDTAIELSTARTIPTPPTNTNWSVDGQPYLGDWNISLTPTFGDLVSYSGDVYQNNSGSNSVVDPATDGGSNWDLYVSQFIGVWDANTTYAINDVVSYGSDIYYHVSANQEMFKHIAYSSNQFVLGDNRTDWMKLDSTKLTVARIEPPFGNLNLASNNFIGIVATSGIQIGLTASTSSISIGATNQIYMQVGNTKYVFQMDNSQALFTDANDGKGIRYTLDYSATFVTRSLVDKGYVDNSISSAVSSALTSYVPYSGATGSVTLGANAISTTVGIITPNVTADGSAGVRINNNSGGAVLTLGAGGGTGATFAGGVVHSTLTGTGTRMVTITNAGLLSVGTVDQDIEITDTTKGVILKDSGGGRWRITVGTSGNLITTSI